MRRLLTCLVAACVLAPVVSALPQPSLNLKVTDRQGIELVVSNVLPEEPTMLAYQGFEPAPFLLVTVGNAIAEVPWADVAMLTLRDRDGDGDGPVVFPALLVLKSGQKKVVDVLQDLRFTGETVFGRYQIRLSAIRTLSTVPVTEKAE